MLVQGLILMCAGMGTVFAFLVVLINAINISSRIVRSIEAKIEAKNPKPQPANTDETARIAAAIAIGRTLLNAK